MGRKLDYRPLVKIQYTHLKQEYLNFSGKYNYERGTSVLTKYGIVIVSDIVWEHNFGFTRACNFTTVFDGIKYSAWLNEGKLSDRQIKWISTNFIKTVLKDLKK